MKPQTKTRWPAAVPVLQPGDVGKGWHGDDGHPVCALGWCNQILTGHVTGHSDKVGRFVDAYAVCAEAVGYPRCGVTYTNDRAEADERALLVNATFAFLGYVVGQDRAALKLAERAKASVKSRRA